MANYLQLVALLTQLLFVQPLLGQDCSTLTYPPGFTDSVVESVCSFDQHSESAKAFRNETRHDHNEFMKTDVDDRYALLGLFNPGTTYVESYTECEDVYRENVTWCVRIADVNRKIETCISLDDNLDPVYESTCDAQFFELEKHISLPDKASCISSFFSSRKLGGCLGLVNMGYIFKDVYLTSIVDTGNCSDVTFQRFTRLPQPDKPPTINEITTSPYLVQPYHQIILRAEVTSISAIAFIVWQKDDNAYSDHIREDPFCDPDTETCRNDTHPDVHLLREKRIRSYFYSRTLSENCLGSSVFSLETYLIIDNVTNEDAGMYVVNVTTQNTRVFSDTEDVTVVVGCEENILFDIECTQGTVAVEKGNNTEWSCRFKASPAVVSVVLNKTKSLTHFDLTGKEDLAAICAEFKQPQALYDVVAEPVNRCYNQYYVHVMVCSTDESLTGTYSVVLDNEIIIEKSTVEVKFPPQDTAHLKDGSGEDVSPAVFVVPVVVLIIVLVCVATATIIIIRMRKRKRARSHLTHLHSPDPNSSAPEAVFYKQRIENGQFSPVSLLSPHSVRGGAYNDDLEFPRNRLYVYTKKVLGEGSFGRVLQAKAEGIVPGMPERNIVAIKTTKENATSIEIEELLSELYLMKNIEPHENILNLLGQCTTPGGPVCLIVEFAKYGNLRDFLRQCEEVVLSLNHKPHIPRNRSRTRTFSSSSVGSTQPLIMRQDSSVFTPGAPQQQFVFPFPPLPTMKTRSTSSTSSDDNKQTAHHPNTAMPLAHTVAPIGHDYINSKGLVFMEDVHNFALQIACGLQHLSNMQIVHCDLAARNILIAEGFVLKIADFGLARDISGKELYKKNPRGKIPVKWTAPEALENRIFTIKSDVWSYGVVLWELFTYGHTPYPEVHLGSSYETIISYLKEGNRMEKPESCSDEFYELMQQCWSFNPNDRPTPVDIVAKLTPLDVALHEEHISIPEETEKDCKSNGTMENGTNHLDEK